MLFARPLNGWKVAHVLSKAAVFSPHFHMQISIDSFESNSFVSDQTGFQWEINLQLIYSGHSLGSRCCVQSSTGRPTTADYFQLVLLLKIMQNRIEMWIDSTSRFFSNHNIWLFSNWVNDKFVSFFAKKGFNVIFSISTKNRLEKRFFHQLTG